MVIFPHNHEAIIQRKCMKIKGVCIQQKIKQGLQFVSNELKTI